MDFAFFMHPQTNVRMPQSEPANQDLYNQGFLAVESSRILILLLS